VACQLALSAALYLLILALLPDTEKIRCRRGAVSIIIRYTVTKHYVILQHHFLCIQGWQKTTTQNKKQTKTKRKTSTFLYLGNVALLDIRPILGTASAKLLNKTKR